MKSNILAGVIVGGTITAGIGIILLLVYGVVTIAKWAWLG